MDLLLQPGAHPFLLLFSAAISIAASRPVARFFFEDWETFLSDLGYRGRLDLEFFLLHFGRTGFWFPFRFAGFVGTLGLILILVYWVGSKALD